MHDSSEVLELDHISQAVGQSSSEQSLRYRAVIRKALLRTVGITAVVLLVGSLYFVRLNPDVQLKLGNLYDNGSKVIPRNNVKATKWYQKAAMQGDANAQLKLGNMYASGQGVSQDLVTAFNWYQKAAAQGNVEAQGQLGSLYLAGSGVAQNVAKGFELLSAAAERGNVGAESRLGKVYATGIGMSEDEQFLDAESNQTSSEDVISQSQSGKIFQDNAKAAYWYQKAAVQGDAEAESALGLLYAIGRGVPQSAMNAYTLETLAAARGFTPAVTLRDQYAERVTEEQVSTAVSFSQNWTVGQPIVQAS